MASTPTDPERRGDDRATGGSRESRATRGSDDDRARRRGAYAVRGPQRRRGLLGLLLALGALAVAAAIAIPLIAGGDDSDPAGQVRQQADGARDDTAAGAADDGTGGSAQGGTGSSAGTGAAAGTLTAAGAGILPGRPATIADHVGDGARGRGLRVLSVVPGEGFFVGTGPEDESYVEFGGGVGEDERGRLPSVGDVVDLEGPVRPAPENPGRTLNLSPEQARVVAEQGAYVNAERVAPAG